MTPSADPALAIAVVARTPEEAATQFASLARIVAESTSTRSAVPFVRVCVNADAIPALQQELAAHATTVVVVITTESYIAAVEHALGRRFDLSLRADEADTPDRLRSALADYGEWTRVGLWGGAAGALEMTLGAALHALRVPLRGAALCSAQAATLTLASAKLRPPGRVAWVAFVTAGLKAFSPGGGRVRPMIAITVQGAAFGSAVQLFGWNAASVTLGGAAIGTWAALQGFLVQYLLLGDDLAGAYGKASTWLAANWSLHAPSLSVLLGTWAALHATLAASAAWAAWKFRTLPRPLRAFAPTENAATSSSNSAVLPPRARWPQRLAREFGRWHFWLPLLLVAGVLLAAGRSWEDISWLVLRFAAVGVVLFAALSLFQPAALARRMRRFGWWGPAAALTEAFARRANR